MSSNFKASTGTSCPCLERRVWSGADPPVARTWRT